MSESNRVWTMIALPALIGACVAAAGAIFFAWRVNSGLQGGLVMQQSQELRMERETVRMIETIVQSQQHQIGMGQLQNAAWAAAKNLRMMTLEPTAAQPTGQARIFWDVDDRRWHFFAIGMKTPAAGKQYELWATSAGSPPRPLAGFLVSPEGETVFAVRLPIGLEPTGAEVTEEPERQAVISPTGAVEMK